MTGSPILLAILAIGFAMCLIGLTPVLAGLFATGAEEHSWKYRLLLAGIATVVTATAARMLPL